MNFAKKLIVIIKLLAAFGGLLGIAKEFSGESSALSFLLIVTGILACLEVVTRLQNFRRRTVVLVVTAIVGGYLIVHSWTRGGPHALWEEVACGAGSHSCISARIARISQNFHRLTVHAFNKNSVFSEQEKAIHQAFCVKETGNNEDAQVALFKISTISGKQETFAFNYALKSGPNWEITAHTPIKSEETPQANVDMGILDLSDRVTRTQMSIGPDPATIIVRVCGVPRNAAGVGQVVRGDFWTSLDVEKIDVKTR